MTRDTSRAAPDQGEERGRLLAKYASTRARTEALSAPLSVEDQQIQSMPDASPTKWHRAHVTWFFEAFVLAPMGIDALDSRYAFLFNSYYEAVGARHPRPKRGLLSRPNAAEIAEYRRIVDAKIMQAVAAASGEVLARILPILELGIAHEEQHQELILTDILHAFSANALKPSYLHNVAPLAKKSALAPMQYVEYEGGLRSIGAEASSGFAFDNERPRHKTWVEPFSIADRLVTIAELKAFIDAGGYRTPSLWLSEGFDLIRAHDVNAPLYCTIDGGEARVFTLAGERIARDDEPAAHLSYYEADAIARFLGARLPTEAEWETIADDANDTEGNFADDGLFRPASSADARATPRGVHQLFGDVWEWTRSSYEPYPGYRAANGALGEYNGKFMVNQFVLRGGSCLTPRGHARKTYRNFWPPPTQFQMTGLRLAREVT
jgi:ergothioneine biosynthesis protein EgtB